MDEFRPSVDHVDGGGRNHEIINASTLKTASDVYVGGRSHITPYDPNPYHRNGIVEANTTNGLPSKKPSKKWWNDPETKRRKRVAKYKFYSVEGKIKTSITRGYRWFKRRCSKIVLGL